MCLDVTLDRWRFQTISLRNYSSHHPLRPICLHRSSRREKVAKETWVEEFVKLQKLQRVLNVTRGIVLVSRLNRKRSSGFRAQSGTFAGQSPFQKHRLHFLSKEGYWDVTGRKLEKPTFSSTWTWTHLWCRAAQVSREHQVVLRTATISRLWKQSQVFFSHRFTADVGQFVLQPVGAAAELLRVGPHPVQLTLRPTQVLHLSS